MIRRAVRAQPPVDCAPTGVAKFGVRLPTCRRRMAHARVRGNRFWRPEPRFSLGHTLLASPQWVSIFLPMPELAEVEYYRQRWNCGLGDEVLAVAHQAGKRIFRGHESSELARTLTGSVLRSSHAHGKQMLFRFSRGGWSTVRTTARCTPRPRLASGASVSLPARSPWRPGSRATAMGRRCSWPRCWARRIA